MAPLFPLKTIRPVRNLTAFPRFISTSTPSHPGTPRPWHGPGESEPAGPKEEKRGGTLKRLGPVIIFISLPGFISPSYMKEELNLNYNPALPATSGASTRRAMNPTFKMKHLGPNGGLWVP